MACAVPENAEAPARGLRSPLTVFNGSEVSDGEG